MVPTLPRLGRFVASALFASIVLARPIAAHAQNEGGAAAAESLFQEGRKLMDQRRYGEACPKLAASHKLAPGVGTLLNLADCYEKDNKLASAWARFHEAIALAQRLGRKDREQTARERADRLEPRLIRLTILAKDRDVEVKLDGNVLDGAALGTPVPVDAGKHGIEARAKGKKPFTTTLEVSERTKTPSVEIPRLEDEPEPEPKVVTPPPTEPGNKEPTEDSRSDGKTQRIIGITTAGLGLVGVAVGSIFGLKTSSTWEEAMTHCTGLECDRTGVELATDAKNSGTVSTIAFIAGGVLVAGGLVLFFTAPSARAGATRVGVGPGSIVVGGSF
ncbi:MAG: hypothetical protein JST00_29245 [Deltaproteobacteria bacterium]|nr:hypothetical protein [Deltaproteobacteria bacterium]